MDITHVEIPPIVLDWSEWYPWPRFLKDARTDPLAVDVPSAPGVYEARYCDGNERLTIGRASDLRLRVKQGLVKGKLPHSAGKRIRASADTARIVVRWAVTDRPAAVEEELHAKHIAAFGRLPRYTETT